MLLLPAIIGFADALTVLHLFRHIITNGNERARVFRV